MDVVALNQRRRTTWTPLFSYELPSASSARSVHSAMAVVSHGHPDTAMWWISKSRWSVSRKPLEPGPRRVRGVAHSSKRVVTGEAVLEGLRHSGDGRVVVAAVGAGED